MTVSAEPIAGDGVELVTPDVGSGPQPLLDAAIAEAGAEGGLRLEVHASVPPGASLGTSAAVVVAVLAALRPEWSPAELARRAHLVETERLGLQSGVQRNTTFRNALAAYDAVLSVRAEHALAWIRLYRSLGGGFNADASTNTASSR